MPKHRDTTLPAPFLKRIWLEREKVSEPDAYPFCLPFLRGEFDWRFYKAITVIVGENGTGKSTLLEGIAALIGFDEAGGGVGYRPVDHSKAIEKMGSSLSSALRAAWLPKVSRGWFFRAESFFSVARHLDLMAREAAEAGVPGGPPPDFLSHSHGEGFLRFFEERCQRQGVFIFDEPESALSPSRQIEFLPSRQIEFLKLLRAMDTSKKCQVIMATHSPMLMAYPGADLLRLTPAGLAPTSLEDTDHFRLMRAFMADPAGFVEASFWD